MRPWSGMPAARRTIPPRTTPAVERQVIAARTAHPEWGKRRLADELAKAQGWVPLVCPNTVKRILRDAGLWEGLTSPAKKGGRRV